MANETKKMAKNFRQRNRFARGSGCYTCRACGRRTREVGDGAQVQLCEPCYDLAGWQNSISDNGPTEDSLEACRTATKTILSKGGKLNPDDFWAELSQMDEIHEMAIIEGQAR